MTILREGHGLLRQKSETFDFDLPQYDLTKLIDRLTQNMLVERGIGLSAIQIGVPVRVFVMVAERGSRDVKVFVNPEILEQSTAKQVGDEGCLSFPGLFVRVARAMSIRAQWRDRNGATIKDTFDGLLARCFQHEMDHLDGKTLIDVAAPQAVLIARKKLAQRTVQKRRAY